MNKEVKVGLGVILALMIVFISTVGWRLYRSRVAAQVSAAGENGSETPESAAKAGNDAPTGSEDASSPAGRPRVIAAATASAKAPQSGAGDDDLWNTVSDAGKNRISAGGGSQPSRRPSYMPEPSRADVGDRHDRYATADRTASVQPGERGDISGDSGQGDAASFGNDSRRGRTSAVSALGGRAYTVGEGESLFDIARTELGKASRWVEIYDLNADVLGNNIDTLTPGTKIILPDDNAKQADPLTRR